MDYSDNNNNDDDVFVGNANDQASLPLWMTTRVVVTTIVCIVVIQYRVPLMEWCLSWSIWMHLYSLFEMIRFLFPLEFEDDEEEYDHDIAITRRGLGGVMPQLEECQVRTTVESESSITRQARKRQCDELEPAFLSDKDYPPGWMVYDVQEGVISKVHADQVCEKRKQQARRNVDENAAGWKNECLESTVGIATADEQEQPSVVEERIECLIERTEKRSGDDCEKEATAAVTEKEERTTCQADDDDDKGEPQPPVVTAS